MEVVTGNIRGLWTRGAHSLWQCRHQWMLTELKACLSDEDTLLQVSFRPTADQLIVCSSALHLDCSGQSPRATDCLLCIFWLFLPFQNY